MNFLGISVTGAWTRSEIVGSYTANPAVCVLALLLTAGAILVIGIRFKAGTALTTTAIASALVSGTAYFLIARYLASSLSIDAPLYVKVHGFLQVPFWFATKAPGLMALAILFILANVFGLFSPRKFIHQGLFVLAMNLAVASILVAATIGAAMAVTGGFLE